MKRRDWMRAIGAAGAAARLAPSSFAPLDTPTASRSVLDAMQVLCCAPRKQVFAQAFRDWQ